ncbi:peptidoglycan-binding protein [Kitasatospora sp. NPDC088134]|uniref:peptidoglycan-binding protein n=1 Tax=Kitasatospora sp. NPDC088134 TaxID=3364071 RepID=UPI0037F5333D
MSSRDTEAAEIVEREDAAAPSGPGAAGDARRSRLSRRRTVLVASMAAITALTGGGAAASLFVKSPAQAAADTRPPAPDVLTAPVEYRVLARTVTVRGLVTPGQVVEVAPTGAGESSARSVVTKLPVQVGSSIAAGQVLLEVSGRPVFVLPGALPVYRDLKPGATGQDVAQLQEALRALGHPTGGDPAGTFGDGTKAALAALYAAAGYEPRPAAPEGAAQVEAAADAVTGAERSLQDAIEAGRAAADPRGRGTAAPGSPSTGAAPAGAAAGADRQVDRAKEDLAKARARLARLKAADGPMLPAAEVAFVQSFPARVDTVTAQVGSPVSGKVMTLSSGALVVGGTLSVREKGLVHPGQKVEVFSEATGITAAATVAAVADTTDAPQQDAAGSGPQQAPGVPGYRFRMQPDAPLDQRLTAQDVRVTVAAASSEGKVLVVPVSAVSSTADGRTVVTVLRAGRRERVEVTPGISGDGCAEIRPTAPGTVVEGDRVVVGTENGKMPG